MMLLIQPLLCLLVFSTLSRRSFHLVIIFVKVKETSSAEGNLFAFQVLFFVFTTTDSGSEKRSESVLQSVMFCYPSCLVCPLIVVVHTQKLSGHFRSSALYFFLFMTSLPQIPLQLMCHCSRFFTRFSVCCVTSLYRLFPSNWCLYCFLLFVSFVLTCQSFRKLLLMCLLFLSDGNDDIILALLFLKEPWKE